MKVNRELFAKPKAKKAKKAKPAKAKEAAKP